MFKVLKSICKMVILLSCMSYISFVTPQAHNAILRYEVGSSVVQVLSPEKMSGGTGFSVRGDSGEIYIMTNRHVCEVAIDGIVRVKQDGGESKLKKVIHKDPVHDLCLVEGDEAYAPLRIGDGLYKGESMHIVGHPGLRQLTVSTGEYIGLHTVQLLDSSVKKIEQCKGDVIILDPFEQLVMQKEWLCLRNYNSYATTAVAYGGNSGSPVVNKWGSVVGVLFAGNPEQNTDNFVVPVKEIKRVLSQF